ncbi:hypothetical protein JYQ62_18635 [Nostoc sp. UHCC 0702]|nr:hypothetical protein JYQ62_18635 [Nostoc sp. UHCC 0702]
MNRILLGRKLIIVTAILTIIVPIGIDGFLLAKAHMANPLWLPHAKLHCAMSFFAAISLGVSSLAVLITRPVMDRISAAIATFLSTTFWVGLVLAGTLPGTSYGFLNDPNLTNLKPPIVFGISIELNFVTAILSIILGWFGFVLIFRGVEQHRKTRLR